MTIVGQDWKHLPMEPAHQFEHLRWLSVNLVTQSLNQELVGGRNLPLSFDMILRQSQLVDWDSAVLITTREQYVQLNFCLPSPPDIARS